MRALVSRSRLQLLAGITIGFLISIMVSETRMFWRTTVQTAHAHVEEDHLIGLVSGSSDNLAAQIEDSHVHHDDDSVAAQLSKSVRVLCWVMTAPKNFRTKADIVKKTWAHRCNIFLFFSSVADDKLPAIALNVSEGREHLTAKTMQAFKYIYKNYFDKADWFMKCDDDTFVIVENLRYFLSTKNTSEPVYFGQHFHVIVEQGYYSGGAGYVLSKTALQRFAEQSGHSKVCKEDGGAEDVAIGKCMQNLGVKIGNSTDSLGRSRFHCFSPETHVNGGFPKWYFKWAAGGAKQGIENISDYAVSFHYMSPQKMLSLEFYVYHLRPYGIISNAQSLN